MISMAMFNSYVKWPEGTHHLPTIIPSCSGRVGRRRTFFHPICLGQLLIFTHPMSGTSHHLSNSWENSASISIICFLRLNIHENPGVSDFRDFPQNFFRCFPMAARKNTMWIPCFRRRKDLSSLPIPIISALILSRLVGCCFFQGTKKAGRMWIPKGGNISVQWRSGAGKIIHQ